MSVISNEQWAAVRGLAAWLDEHNGRDQHELSMRIFKLTEEVGEAAQAYIGMTGQNPRKGTTHTLDDLLGEIGDVVVTALIAGCSFSDDFPAVLDAKLAKIVARAAKHRAESPAADQVTIPSPR